MATPETVDLAGLPIHAISIAGVETCIEVPSWKLAFDIGKAPDSASRYRRVFFTHGHIDHIGSVAHHCGTRHMRGMSPPIYALEEANAAGLEGVLEAFRKIDHSELPCSIERVAPGDVVEVSKKRRVRVFRSVHRVPTLGFALEEDRHGLHPDFLGRPGPEIAAARAAGRQVREVRTNVELAFCGDTTIHVVEQQEIVRTAKRLILECTFLDDTVTVERARKTGHVHLDDLCERAELFENEAILLTHFSARYSRGAIVDTLKRRLPTCLQGRVQPLLAGFR